MPAQFNVVFTGEMKPGTEKDTFVREFSRRFQCDEAKAASVFDAGTATLMKSAVEQEVAEKYRDVLEAMGMTIRLEPLAAEATPASQPAAEEENPYQAPKANLQDASQHGEMSGPVSVPFAHGWHWISSAYHNHVSGNMLPWVGAIIVYMVIIVIVQLIPLLGMIASTVLASIFAGGFMIGARAQDDGEPFRVGYLFDGFKQSTGQLALVGVIYLVGTIVLIAIPAILMGGAFSMFAEMSAGDPAATQSMGMDPMAMMLPMLVFTLLIIPLVMAYWFAPALVVNEGMSALSAMKASFTACAKNVLPFLLYGIAMMVLMLLAMIPLGLGLFVLVPVITASIYTAYRDIFYPVG